jgi:hypothetical protein
MSKLKNFAPALGWGIFVFVLSTLPGKDFPEIPDWLGLFSVDKIVHILFYGILTGLILRGVIPRPREGKKSDLLPHSFSTKVFTGFVAALGATAFGWFLEWYQENYCEDRVFDVLDGVANTIGAFISWISFSISSYYKLKKTP